MRTQLIRLSYLEGSSLLLLLFVAMPIKYLAGNPLPVRVIGMAHGILFLLLVAMMALVAKRDRWPAGLVLFAFISSCIPFGMIALDRRLKREPPDRSPD